MFTKEDFLDYFDQLQALEIQMKETYADLAKKVQDPEFREIFSRLSREERGHEKRIEVLKEEFRR